MCLIIKSGPHTAKRNFYTLKMAEEIDIDKCKSFYMLDIQFYKHKITSRLDVDCEIISKGLHSIYDPHGEVEDINNFENAIGRGVVLSKIPRGATYYIGQNGDIVSNKIELIEPLVVNDNLLGEEVAIEGHTGMKSALILAYKIAKSYNYNMKPS